ncbi:MAG TPA: 3-dehydroquinate synthase, partial [Thermodesulfovibrionales bacterium]|nr:3-dehydroquinate synthase [Thermodesulfovibrionales bacterium]
MEAIRVELGERSYEICIGPAILPLLGERLREFHFSRVALVSNPTVYALYGNRLADCLKKAGFDAAVVTIPDGEQYKELLWA